MKFSIVSLCILTPALWFSQVTAENILRRVIQERQNASPYLNPDNVPTPCDNQCATLVGLSSCASYSCLCTEAVNLGMYTCLNCTENLNGPAPTSVIEIIQASLQEYEDACKSQNLPLSSLTLPGVPAGATIAVPSGVTFSILPTPTSSGGGGQPTGKASGGGGKSISISISNLVFGGIVGVVMLIIAS